MLTFDVIIVGTGAMGSAAAWHLAERGQRVLAIDRHHPPHAFGSSHGATRIIREAYFEHPQYVPLVQRAYQRWAALEARMGLTLFQQTGGLMIGPPDGVLVRGALASAHAHRLPHERLAAGEATRRYPALRLREDMVAVHEPRAGVLPPERCIAAMLGAAERAGASFRFDDAVIAWSAGPDGVEVTSREGRVSAARLVLSAGPWMRDLIGDVTVPLTVERTVLHWFDPAANAASFDAAHLPIWLLEHAPGRMIYGFPATGDGVKVARHYQGQAVHPDRVDRVVAPGEVDAMRPLIRQFLPDLDGAWRRSAVCMYTNTPDADFVIDHHPAHANVLIVSPCSGHGFKFASAIGEAVADLVVDGHARADLSPFALARFRRPPADGPNRALVDQRASKD